MLKKAMAAAAVAASVIGVSAAAAPPALAIGNDAGTTSASGNGAHAGVRQLVTKGDESPQAALVQGTANKLCVGLPVKANVSRSSASSPTSASRTFHVLSAPQNQQCAENSTQAKGDEPLSHIVDDISALSGNGAANRLTFTGAARRTVRRSSGGPCGGRVFRRLFPAVSPAAAPPSR